MANRRKSLDNGVMTGQNDRYNLERFVRAQDDGGTYRQVLAELRRGRKTGHWMWFIFPQVAGLGSSPMAQRFAISSLDEARQYLRHPVLGARLRESAGLALEAAGAAHGSGAATVSALEVFGGIDSIKLRSSMTLFLRAGSAAGSAAGGADGSAAESSGESAAGGVAERANVFQRVLETYFDGTPDESTDRLLAGAR
jgi:uncharacterized protein (DUF1810 family)